VNILFVRQKYLSKSTISATLHQLKITACLCLRRLFPLNSTLSITNLCTVYADICVMLYSDVIIQRVWLITASDRIELHQTMSDHVCKREIAISKALHILTINCVINLPTISSVCSEVYCRSRSRSGARWKSGGVEWSSEQELQKNDGTERKIAEREAGLNYRNRLEHGAAFSPLTLRSGKL